MRDSGRLVLSIALAFLFMGTVATAFAVAIWGGTSAKAATRELLQVVVPAEMALLGAAVAYYFAS